jgi:cysteine synthase A
VDALTPRCCAQEALACGALRPGGLVTEGTAGSTGISLAMVAPAFGALQRCVGNAASGLMLTSRAGCRCHVAMPDDAAEEKATTIRALGATVERVRPVSITHPQHFVNVARRAAEAATAADGPGGGFFADQFENGANFRAHYEARGVARAARWVRVR